METDSDSTLPCVDEVMARMYEMDIMDGSSYRNISDSSPSSKISHSTITSQSKIRHSIQKNQSSKYHLATSTKRSRPVRQSRRPARVADVYVDTCSDDDDFTDTSTPALTVLTRTRTGRHNFRGSPSTFEDEKAAPENNESEITTIVSSLTPEQIELRQRRIERRRESAKNKAEKEMQETVERLLRVNTDYGDSVNGGRGRARRGPAGVESDSEESNGEKKKRNTLHPSLPLDPPSGSIRFISSQRIYPHCVVALPVGDAPETQIDFLSRLQKAPLPPKIRLCDQCHSAPRRYACRKTGRSLCSLECFKAC